MARYMVKIGNVTGGGQIKFGFYAPDSAYDNIGDELGVTKLAGEAALNESDRRGIVFGANSPKPPKVRISYTVANLGGGSSNDVTRAVGRFCAPDKLNAVLNGSIVDKKIKVRGAEYNINAVSMYS